MTLAREFSADAHRGYVSYLKHEVGWENHPDPDTARVWIDMRRALGRDLYEKARRWAAAVPYHDRPGAWVDSTTHPRAVWSISEPVVMAIGRAMEPAVSAALGQRAWISYGGLTVQFRDIPVAPHRDVNRGSKFLLSWPLLLDIEGGWPIHVECASRSPEGSVEIDTFDNSFAERALLFAGHDVWHWRDGYPGDEGKLFFMRYTLNDTVRMHSASDVDLLVEAGLAELDGRPVPPLPDGVIVPNCNYPSEPERDFVLAPGLFDLEAVARILTLAGTAQDCQEAVYEDPTKSLRVRWFEDTIGGADAAWIWERLRRQSAAAAPPLIPDCPDNWEYVPRGSLQVGYYVAGDKIDWHPDASPQYGANGQARKLSVVVMLENAEAGGVLELERGGRIGLAPGDAVLFPSDMPHRITPVEKGRRVSMTAWYGTPDHE